MLADAEVLKVFCQLLCGFKFPFLIKLNDRRLLDLALTRAGCQKEQFNTVCSSIDKLDKEPWEAVSQELLNKKLSPEQVQKLHEFVNLTGESFMETHKRLQDLFGEQQVLDDLLMLYDYLGAMDIIQYIKFDLSLARGLDYYTGMIFEAVLQGEYSELGIGSVAAGGRYDHLIGKFSKQGIPSAGGSLGIERIFNILEMKSKEDQQAAVVDVAIAVAGKVAKSHVLKVASWLWDADIRTEIFYENMKMAEYLQTASSKGAKWLVIIGEEELKDD